MDEDRSYYHGRISRDEAIRRLEGKGENGAFLLRMSETQDGVYTVSVMQGNAVRHVRVIEKTDGYSLMQEQEAYPSVWALIDSQMNKTLSSAFNSRDIISLRMPLKNKESVIAPDLFDKAEEAGMDAADLDEDVATFLQGGVDTKELVRRRSMKQFAGKNVKKDALKEVLGTEDTDLQAFMNGELTASELGRKRSVSEKSRSAFTPKMPTVDEDAFLKELEEFENY
eukprot:m.37763 g.37763  ORF g.37763 m.37763 type:complete len:226 (+) comp6759_c0_seq1:1370-2047(+)